MKHSFVALFVISLFMPAIIVFAQSSNSGSYKGYNLGTTPATVQASSPNYRLNASIESIVGETATSANYQGGAGAPKPGSTTTIILPTTTNAGGIPDKPSDPLGLWSFPGTGAITKPTIMHRPWTYLATGLIKGNRGTSGAEIIINKSSLGIEYPSAMTYQRQRYPLALGNNALVAQAKVGGSYSLSADSVMRRRLQGDYNDSQFVDDIDLSLFSRAWEHHPDIYADFNEDGKVDDVDLSLLVSHWNHSF